MTLVHADDALYGFPADPVERHIHVPCWSSNENLGPSGTFMGSDRFIAANHELPAATAPSGSFIRELR